MSRPCKFRCTGRASDPPSRAKSKSPTTFRRANVLFRPRAALAYEHMFPPASSPKVNARRAPRERLRSAIALAAAALTLADDAQPPDWCLPPEYLSLAGGRPQALRTPSPTASAAHRPPEGSTAQNHPHRRPLSRRPTVRRAGSPATVVQPCLSPLRGRHCGRACRLPTR